MAKTKNDIHDEAYAAYIASGDDSSGRKSAVIQGTGTGKTKLAVSVSNYFHKLYGPKVKILWLTNSTKLRDEDTPDDFNKWGARHIWDSNITAECYQTVYKWTDTKWDLVIADEGDFCLTEEYIKFFYNNSYKNLLFLTATVKDDKQPLLAELADICFTYTTQQAQDDGVLNSSHFTIVDFDLERVKKEIVVEFTKNGQTKQFAQTENDAYIYLEKQLGILYGEKEKIEGELYKARFHKRDTTDLDTKFRITNAKIQRAISKRKEFLWNLASSRRATHKLLTKILVGEGNEGNKALVFCARVAQADKVCKNSYHGGNSKNSKAIEKLNKGEIQALAVVQSINRGANLVGVNHIIKESYNGSYVDFQQQHGRGTRLDPSESLHFWILRPYYWINQSKKNPDGSTTVTAVRRSTQAVTWSIDMTQQFDITNALFININKL